MSVTSVDKDFEGLTLTVIADFTAPVEAVWQLWADPRKLERWWGPPTYPATVEVHEFQRGLCADLCVEDRTAGARSTRPSAGTGTVSHPSPDCLSVGGGPTGELFLPEHFHLRPRLVSDSFTAPLAH